MFAQTYSIAGMLLKRVFVAVGAYQMTLVSLTKEVAHVQEGMVFLQSLSCQHLLEEVRVNWIFFEFLNLNLSKLVTRFGICTKEHN